MELKPVMCKPKMRMLFSSSIVQLPGNSEAALTVKIEVTGKPSLGDYFVLIFKVKVKKRFIGPDFVLFVKLNRPESLESSAFEEPIKNATEQFEMASDLQDEGFGTFDRCLSAVRMTDCNLDEARDVLSNIMLTLA